MAHPEDAEAPLLEFAPYDQAMSTEWPTDAHFVTYTLRNSEGLTGEFPRLTKLMESHVRPVGGGIFVGSFVLDFDNPNHAEWDDALREAFISAFGEACDRSPVLSKWACVHTTQHGARIIYILDREVSAHESEGRYRWLVEHARSHGLMVDESVFDWTRMFRLPRVIRDGQPTSRATYFDISERWEQRLPVSDTVELFVPPTSTYATVETFEEPQPDYDEAMALVRRITDKGKYDHTEWATAAKRRMLNREAYPCLFEEAPLAPRGQRDTTLHSYIGQAVSMLYGLEGTTPSHIYGLFLDPVMQLEPDPGTPDWTRVLWSHICRIWTKEQGREKAREEQVTGGVQAELVIDRMVMGMRSWCNHPALMQDQDTARAFVARHAIACIGPKHFLMQADGYYSPLPLDAAQIVSAVRCDGLDGVVHTRQTTGKNTVSDIPSQLIKNNQAVNCGNSVSLKPQISGGYIERLGPKTSHLVLPCYRRNPALTPRYDHEVDRWLQELFQGNYELACKWIGWAVAFEEAEIAALSIVGHPGCGKKLIAHGLKETLEKPELANGNDVVAGFNDGLKASPYIVVNEGWPATMGSGKIADRFRELVSADNIVINEKYMIRQVARVKPRILMTANNNDVVHALAAGRQLSPEDREALSVRLLHFDVGRHGADYLKKRGGYRLTGRPGMRWIAGGEDGESDYVLARHFLWLYENRGERLGDRLAVEGNADNDVIFALQTESGSTPLVIECLIRMLECRTALQGFVVHEDRIFVLASEILKFYRGAFTGAAAERITSNLINSVLRSITLAGSEASYVIEPRKDIGRRRWHELNVELLHQVAERDGWQCRELENIVERKKAEKVRDRELQRQRLEIS